MEPYRWDCDDEALYYFARPAERSPGRPPSPGTGGGGGQAFWRGTGAPSDANPFVPAGWLGTCQFPQITAGGLDDSWRHGADLYAVYHDLLGFLPDRSSSSSGEWRSRVAYRVTQNVITSQVAGMVVAGMWGLARTSDGDGGGDFGGEAASGVPLIVEPADVDSLEPQYPCPAADAALAGVRSSPAWTGHLAAAAGLYAALDGISGVPASDAGFHASLDHYYDNLSARQCHTKPLPCKLVGDGGGDDGGGANLNNNNNSSSSSAYCVAQALADEVYRLGHWEYGQVYRGDARSLAASVGSYGVWVAQLAAHLRTAMVGRGDAGTLLWYHNIAHDGSLSRLLSILQVDVMVWPGMGSEVVFELWRHDGRTTCKGRGEHGRQATAGGDSTRRDGGGGGEGFCVRVLFGGKVLRSSNPSLGLMDMIPVETLLAYFDGLAGQGASLMLAKCNGSIPLAT